MVNQAFRIKIAYRSKKEEEKKKKKIPGIGRYPMGPTNIVQQCARKQLASFGNSLAIAFHVNLQFAIYLLSKLAFIWFRY